MIVVYTTKTCVYCKQIMTWLKNKGRQFTVVDVTDDVEKRMELQRITGYTTVPITKIGDKYIVGVQWGKLAEALNPALVF